MADHAAPANQQATITNTASGLPQVNIQTPSAAGVSRNTYSQFDVSQAGAILNNSRTNVQTQLGGFIQGNPNLATGTARIILNEVNSSNPSLLNGYIEVAGSRAQVVIANPAGISCDGCGFINANRATLTTGTPVMNSGNLVGYRVGGGSIGFFGAGMGATQSDYTDVIARAVQVNAGIYANTLNISTGTNQISVDANGNQTGVMPIAADMGGIAPALSVDVATLGGMYAGKIHLIGTEAGVGVRNAGSIAASAGEVAISADGQLTNTGHIVSSGNTRIHVSGKLDNTGAAIGAGGTLDIESAQLINTNGLIQSTSALTIDTHGQGLLNTNNNVSGGILSNGAIQLATGDIDNTSGYIGATGNVSATSGTINNTSGKFLAQQAMTLNSTALSGDGSLLAHGNMILAFGGNFNNTGEVIANGMLQFTTDGNLVNSGKLQAGDILQVSVADLDNTATGELSGLNTYLTTTGALTNHGLIDGGDTFIQTATLTNIGTGNIFGDHIALSATTLTNNAETVGTIRHAAVIAARGSMNIGADTINNLGNALVFSSGDMAIGGVLNADHLATGQSALLINEGSTIEALGKIDASIADLQNRNAGLVTETVPVGSTAYDQFIPRNQSVVLNSADYPGAQIGNFNISWRTAGPYTFREYTRLVYTGSTTQTQLVSSLPGQIFSGGDMNLNGAISNSDSEIVAGGNLNITGPSLVNLNSSGNVVTSYHGTNYYYDYDGEESCGDAGDGCYDISAAAYNPAASVNSFNLPTAKVEENTAPVSSGTTIVALNVANVGQTVNSSSLFLPTPNPVAGYLIETNPRFANYRTWLSSDYMLSQLSFDGDITQKRLGDGFYEQRLVREQIAQLTGRRFLTGYADDEAQYQALMNAGITSAHQFSLTPGIALSTAQIAQLTSDIVWLVQQEVTLPDGSKTLALVPQVYVTIKADDLNPGSGMMTGNNVQINVSGDLNNGGTIAGRALVNLAAQNINNLGGSIAADTTALTASRDINNLGGDISAKNALVLNAGHDINLQSTTHNSTNTTGASSFSRTNIDRVAGLYVSNADALLVASAGNDINLMAAVIQNSGAGGTTQLSAGNNINMGTVEIAEQNNSIRNSKNYLKLGSKQDIGTTIQTQGDIMLNAGQDITARAATVNSTEGNLNAVAGKDINISAGESSRSLDFARKVKKSGTLSSTTKIYHQTYDGTEAVGSSLGAELITLRAGTANAPGNINVSGSQVVSDAGTALNASGNINVAAVQNDSSELHYKSVKKSGLSASGASVSYGTQKLSANQTTHSTSNTGSTVGSITGNVLIEAGKAYTQIGSDVLAPQGDIGISAQSVNIVAAQNTNVSAQETKFKQSGITLAITNPVIAAVQTAEQMKQASSNTSDSRMEALAAGTTALAAINAYDTFQTVQATLPTGNTAQDAANQVGGVNLSISIGSSKSSSKTTQTSTSAQGSQVAAGGDINITATGAGQDSDVNVIGSQIKAGNDVTLKAEDQIDLIAAQNMETLNSKNKSSSASVGISIGTSGLAVTASASKGKGKARGNDVTWTETQVEAGNKVALESGTDTNIIGSQVRGKQVIADVGTSGNGNLNIQNLQDTSTYDSKQKSAGISVSVAIGAGAYGGSISSSNTKIESDYASVNEQSGIFAGDDGFQVNVAGNTNLTGAVIASTEQAIQDGKNSLTTETLTVSNIQNKAEYEADSSSMGLSMSYNPSESVTKNVGSNLVNLPGTLTPDLNQTGIDSSTTHSAVSAAQIAITNDVKQAALTGKNAETTIATLNRDTANANNGILTKPDITAIQNEMAANASIMSAATQQVTTAINSYYVKRMAEYDQQYNDKLNLARDKEAEAASLNASGKISEADILIAEAQTLRYQAIDIRNERDNPGLSQGLALTLGNILVSGLGGEVNIANATTSYAVGTLGNAFLLTAQKRDSDITQGFIATCKGAPTECAEAAFALDKTVNNADLPLEERIKALADLKKDNTPLFEIRAVDSNSKGLFNIAVNGILNEPDRALVLGIGHLRDGEAIEQSIYLSYNDTQGSLADLLNAAIDQYAKATSNTSDAIVQALIASHGNQQGHGETNLLAHSGGTLSSNVALNDYAAQSYANPNLHIDYFGPASSTGAAVAATLNAAGLAGATPEQQANWLAYGNTEGIKGISSGGLGYHNHANDPVATVAGGNFGQTNQYNDPNSPTHLQGIELGNLLQSVLELKALFTTSDSAHSTYRWNDPSTWPTTTVAPASSNSSK